MSTPTQDTLVSVALPVRNGAVSVVRTARSVLAQSHERVELVICDNASTDATEELCRALAASDPRVVYHRHAENVGLLNNFRFAAGLSTGRYVRWIGDSDWLHPDYLARTLAALAEDERRVLVTTQVVYVDPHGDTTLDRDYSPDRLGSPDALERLAEMLWLLDSGFALLDPMYSLMRRELATLPRRNMLQEDEVFAVRLALAGPWGHVPAPLAGRWRSERDDFAAARLLGVPRWEGAVPDLLQCREMLGWIEQVLGPDEVARARRQVVGFYARRKGHTLLRGTAKLSRLTRSVSVRPHDPRRGAGRGHGRAEAPAGQRATSR